MQFRNKLALGVALALALPAAHADIDPFTNGDSNFALVVRNETTGDSYVRALPQRVSDAFAAGAGFVISAVGPDATLSSFITAATSAGQKLVYGLFAGDSVGTVSTSGVGSLRYVTTTLSPTVSINNTNLRDFSLMNGNFVLGANNIIPGSTVGEGSATALKDNEGNFKPSYDNWNGKAGFSLMADLGTESNLFLLTNTSSLLGAATVTPVSLKINLGTDGTLASVPLPGAVWLLGSALLGLVGVARRRREA